MDRDLDLLKKRESRLLIVVILYSLLPELSILRLRGESEVLIFGATSNRRFLDWKPLRDSGVDYS